MSNIKVPVFTMDDLEAAAKRVENGDIEVSSIEEQVAELKKNIRMFILHGSDFVAGLVAGLGLGWVLAQPGTLPAPADDETATKESV